MAMKQCPDCGEKYSDTYRKCPFCEEEKALSGGGRIRRSNRGGKRAAGRSGQMNLLTPTLIILILIMAALLAYLLFGENFKQRAEKLPADKPGIEAVKPDDEAKDPIHTPDQTPDEPDGSMPEDSDASGDSAEQLPVEQPAESDYDKANKLPKGLTVSNPDFTLSKLGETCKVRVSGGSGNYKWFSEDDGIASVDSNGTITAVSGGTVNVVVTDGSKKGVCIVRVSASGTLAPQQPSGGSGSSTSGSTGSTSGLQAGAGKVINGGNSGVRVRSGPGTSYEALATLPNGADLKIVESASDNWYKISYSDVGGVTKTGYMRGDYLANK